MATNKINDSAALNVFLRDHRQQIEKNKGKIDTDHSGQVSYGELRAYYRAHGNDTVRISAAAWEAVAGSDNALSDAELNSAAEAAGDQATVAPAEGGSTVVPVRYDANAIFEFYLKIQDGSASVSVEGKREEIVNRLRAAIAKGNGVVTKEEFERIFDVSLTDKAWAAFAGSNCAETGLTFQQLGARLTTFEEWNQGQRLVGEPGVSWSRFIGCDRIYVVPQGDNLVRVWRGLSHDEKLAFIEKFRPILGGSFYGRSDEEILRMLDESEDKVDPDRNVRLLLQGIFGRMCQVLRSKNKNALEGLNEQVVSDRLGTTVFRHYLVTRSFPAKIENNLAWFRAQNETVSELRELFGDQADAALSVIDPSDDDYTQVFTRIRTILDDANLTEAGKKEQIVVILGTLAHGSDSDPVVIPTENKRK